MIAAFRLGLTRGLVLGYALGEIAIAVGREIARSNVELLAAAFDSAVETVCEAMATEDPAEWLEGRELPMTGRGRAS